MSGGDLIHGPMTLVSLRLPAELVLAIDGRGGVRGRSAFIREALEASLSSVPAVSDGDALLAVLRDRGLTARQAAAVLGWSVLRVQKVSGKLGASGLVHFPQGMGVMEAK